MTDTLSFPLYYLGIQVLNIFHLIVFFGGRGRECGNYSLVAAPHFNILKFTGNCAYHMV